HLENEALDRAVDRARAEYIRDPQRFHAGFAAPSDLDQRELAADIRPFVGQVGNRADRHQPTELRLDLLDDHARAGGHDGDAGKPVLWIDLGHRQALDIVATAGEQPDDA